MLKQVYIITMLLCYAITFAQEPIRYTTKQGLPTNHVYDLAEDINGFMWFATKQGLVKYDGETFKIFTIKDGLPNNDTWQLETDLQGRLWYFSKSAYQGYIKNDSIYKFATKDKEVITPAIIYKSKDNFWFYGNNICTIKNNELVNSELNVNNFNKFQIEINTELGLNIKNGLISLINPQKKEILFVNEKDKQLLVYDWDFKLKNTFPFNTPKEGLIKSMQFIEAGLIYNQIGYFAFNSGVLFIDFSNYTTKFLSYKDLFGVEIPMYFRYKSLENEIQISIPGNLALLDYKLNIKEKHAFSKELGQYSYKDTRGNLWLTSISNGVSLIPNSQSQTVVVFDGLKVQKVNGIDNNLYVGVNNKGFYKINTNFNKQESLIEFQVPHSEIYQIKKDILTNQYVFVSAINLSVLNNNKLEEFSIKKTKDNYITQRYQYGSKDIVFFKGSYYHVFNSAIIKNTPNNEYVKVIAKKAGLMVAEVFNNNLFVSGSDGLYQISNDSLVKPKLKNEEQNELLNIAASNLEATAKYLLVGTDGRGVYLYNEKELFHIKETDGLSVQKIINIEDALWVATQKGIKKIELNHKDLSNSKIVDAFYDADGLLQNNTNDIYLKDNFLYAASDMGLAKLNFTSPIYRQQPKLYFKSKTDTLNFKNQKRDNIHISFALQDYTNQEYTKYQYRLLPKQKTWTSTITKTLNFSNLEPQLYTLEVKAIDQHNNSSTIKQHLNVIPKWYQSTFNKIGFVLIGLLSFLLFASKLKQRIRKKEQEKVQQEKRVAGLELQALRSQMNPHFVHNSLNAIQYFIQRNEVELSENYLSRFSKLIRLFFEYSRRQTITINEELELLTNYLDIEKLRFEEKLEYRITVCKKMDKEEQLLPSMLLQPIVENAVNHGLFHKKGNGIIHIDFKQLNKDSFQVTVKDDGIGINKAKAVYKVSSKNYQSNSSAVLKERLDLLNKSKEWNIEYTLKDISEFEKDKTGTIATLIFTQNNN